MSSAAFPLGVLQTCRNNRAWKRSSRNRNGWCWCVQREGERTFDLHEAFICCLVYYLVIPLLQRRAKPSFLRNSQLLICSSLEAAPQIPHSFVHLVFFSPPPLLLCQWGLMEYNAQISNCICGVTHLCAGLARNQLSLS